MSGPSATSCGARCGCRSGVSKKFPKSAVISLTRSSMIQSSSCAPRLTRSRLTTTCARIVAAGSWTRLRAPNTPAARRRCSCVLTTAGGSTWKAKTFTCPHKADWKGALTAENTRLSEVKLDTWGGWIWINMDPECRTLARLPRTRARHARSLRAAEHALSLAQVGHLRLQLESRDGGVQRNLPCPDDAPGVQQVRRVSRLGSGAGKAQQHRL